MLVTSAVPDPRRGCCEGERRQGESQGPLGRGRGTPLGCGLALSAGKGLWLSSLEINERKREQRGARPLEGERGSRGRAPEERNPGREGGAKQHAEEVSEYLYRNLPGRFLHPPEALCCPALFCHCSFPGTPVLPFWPFPVQRAIHSPLISITL